MQERFKMEVKNIEDAVVIHDICGEIREVYRSPHGKATLAHATITAPAKSHLHRKTEEIYYVLSGTGKMHVEKEQRDVRPGDAVGIQPGLYHHIERTSTEPLEVLVVASPNFDPSDVFEEQ